MAANNCDSDKQQFDIRPLKEEECDKVMEMIIELAEFEKMVECVNITTEGLKQDIFGEPKRCSCLVAQSLKDNVIVGYALYFYSYSTWERAYIHLEDLYVKPDFRGKGLGKRMYQVVAKVGVDEGCQRVELDVLGWNKTAKQFYEKVGNTDLTETQDWHKMRMSRKAMERFVDM